jgi:hypothetical protein
MKDLLFREMVKDL